MDCRDRPGNDDGGEGFELGALGYVPRGLARLVGGAAIGSSGQG